MKPAIATAVLLALATTGCREESGGTARASSPVDNLWELSPDELKAFEARLKEKLPPGSILSVLPTEGLMYEAGWQRPGFPGNTAVFAVRKEKDTVVVKVHNRGSWTYESGKLSKELALGDDEKNWDWLQKRAAEVAAGTYAATK